jgi:cyclophilin family peptidyl-prolyl cis-trans isomerase
VDDFDPKVRAAAQAAHRALVGGPTFPSARPTRRYPLQPTDTQLNALPGRAVIRMSNGRSITLELLPREAPITVARFAELATLGYYNGLTFHRIAPNFVVQGGSPGANEYVGNPRYWRDEASSVPHTRGAVGISTRGHDTGDGQIFIDLVDLPRLDHDYTVFARVIMGLDVIDQMLEGARIESVTVR